jgi:hypothetical protein
MFARALLIVVTAMLIAACTNSERFREDFGPRDADRAQSIPGK